MKNNLDVDLDSLASVYATACQVHSLDPAAITATLSAIAIELLGARRCVLLLASVEHPGLYDTIELVPGSLGHAPFASAHYLGGDPLVDGCISDGRMRLGPSTVSPLVAAVPLVLQGVVVGALVVAELMPHKPRLLRDDRVLLELIAAHAASALVGARVFKDTQRKLERIVTLMRSPGSER